MSMKIEEIAEGLRAAAARRDLVAWLDFVSPLWAEVVEVRHYPAIDHMDGVQPGEAFGEKERTGILHAREKMPDLVDHLDALRVRDDKITFVLTRHGTRPDGSPILAPALLEFTIRGDGCITKYECWYESGNTQGLAEA
jgi:hypothetical protein